MSWKTNYLICAGTKRLSCLCTRNFHRDSKRRWT